MSDLLLEKLREMTPTEVLARLIWGEARGESLRGQVAVAFVVTNRVKRAPRYGADLIEVMLKPWQFSCFNLSDPNRTMLEDPSRYPGYSQCLTVASLAVQGLLSDPTGGAVLYFNPEIVPGGWPASWDPKKALVTVKIGRHVFCREL